MKKVTILGGGTGTFVVLSGLKNLPVNLGVIVSMMDSGGSTGRLRDQLGVLPPGDLRQCLVALSDASVLWRKLFLYRFENGDLQGHNFGNIFLSALEKVSTNYDEVIDIASYVLDTKGKVIPVTFDSSHLCVEYANGKVLKEEGIIDENNKEESKIVKAYLEPASKANKKAIERIMRTDVLILGPGDLYTSIIPVLLVRGIRDAIQKRNPTIIYVMNLMTKAGQTNHYTAYNHIEDITTYAGKEPDIIVVNNGTIPEEIDEWYETHHEELVKNDLDSSPFGGKVIQGDMIDTHRVDQSSSDVLTRSILRHDSTKLAQFLKPYCL